MEMTSKGEPLYDPRSFPPIAVAVDIVLFVIRGGTLFVLLVRRGEHPFRGEWALPGGFVQPTDENLDRAAERPPCQPRPAPRRPAPLHPHPP